MNTPNRVLIADDHPAIRAGLGRMVVGAGEFTVVAEACDGAQAVRCWQALRPDIGLVDLRMPVMDGFDAIAAICADSPGARIVAVTTLEGNEDVHRALRAGATGYLLKDCEQEELLSCMRCVLRGQRYLQPIAASRLAERVTMAKLTPRETDVLVSLATGLSNKHIARHLQIGDGTVKFHVKAVLEKLGASSRTEAVRVAQQRGLLYAGD